jgi:hypothetical protein
VARLIREGKRGALAGGGFDPVAALRDRGPEMGRVLRYLARTLADGSPQVDALIDEIAEDAVEYSEEYVAAGLMTASDDPRGRAVVLTVWSLGALALHEHVNRLLGADMTGSPEQMAPYLLPATEILSRGVVTEEAYRVLRAALSGRAGEAAEEVSEKRTPKKRRRS